MKSLRFLGILGICLLRAAAQQPAQQFVPSDELNVRLPHWLKFSGEYRARFEGFENGAFKDNNDDAYYLSRLRINLTIQPASWLKFVAQGQDARVFGKNQKPYVAPYQDTMNLRLGYVELRNPEVDSISARVGRQELNFGDQRLVGSLNWTNTARSFDAARITVRHQGYRLDVFAASVVNLQNNEFEHHTQGNNLHGLYGGIEKLVPQAVIEPYVFWRLSHGVVSETGKIGKLDTKTAGIRWAGKLPVNFDYNVEMAYQTGMQSTDDVKAWAGHWQTGYTFVRTHWKPRLIAEYNYASGDGNGKDGNRHTFDQLYPTGHDKYGLADQVGWRNIHDLRTGVEFKPRAKWQVSGIFHDWWLADAHDALYAANSAAVAKVATGTAGRHVGEELDGQAVYTWNKQLQSTLR